MLSQSSLTFACPRCGSLLEQTALEELRCPSDSLVFRRIDGIWRMLLPESEAIFSQFTQEYETVRRAEGRGSETPEYYRSLPNSDLSGRMAGDWRIRSASFDALLKNIVRPMEEGARQPLRVLDLGAGNCWLANRLACRGHIVVAVDLMTNDFDGLGCFRYYETVFIPIQAEFDHLPLANQTADLVVFNASLHYSTCYEKTLREALRVLDPAGKLVVLDSPVYQDKGSGAKMVQERESQFTRKYGFPSNALPSENYLTYQRLAELSAALQLNYRIITPFYGIRWMLRPLAARLRGNREPAKFHLLALTNGLENERT